MVDEISKTFSQIMSEIADDLVVKLDKNTFNERKLVDTSVLQEQGS